MIPAIEFENVSFEYGTPARAAKKRGLFCGRRLAAKRVLSAADAAGDSVGGAGKGCQGGAQARCRERAVSGAASSDRPCAAEGGARQSAGVRNVSFALLPGEFVAVIGNNGAGKTTLSKLMNGLLKPTSGRVLIDGVPTTELRTSALAARVGMLFQNPDRQICQPTVRDEIALGLRLQVWRTLKATLRASPTTSSFQRTRRRLRFRAANGSVWRLRPWWRASRACWC